MARVQARSKTRNYSHMDAYKCKSHSKKKKCSNDENADAYLPKVLYSSFYSTA